MEFLIITNVAQTGGLAPGMRIAIDRIVSYRPIAPYTSRDGQTTYYAGCQTELTLNGTKENITVRASESVDQIDAGLATFGATITRTPAPTREREITL